MKSSAHQSGYPSSQEPNLKLGFIEPQKGWMARKGGWRKWSSCPTQVPAAGGGELSKWAEVGSRQEGVVTP